MGLTLDITTTGSIIKSILVESRYEQEYFPRVDLVTQLTPGQLTYIHT